MTGLRRYKNRCRIMNAGLFAIAAGMYGSLAYCLALFALHH